MFHGFILRVGVPPWVSLMGEGRLAALFSGGKDSTFALHSALKEGFEVAALITMKPHNAESWMFHHPCIDLTALQSESLDLPQITMETRGEKEKELEDLAAALTQAKEQYTIRGIVSGAIASRYQKSRVDRLCQELGLASHAPLWGRDPEALLKAIVGEGFEVVVTSVSALGLTEEWIGRRLDQRAIEELRLLHDKFGIHMSFEGGEAETLVLDGPIFKKRIILEEWEKVWRGDSGVLNPKRVRLVEKELGA